MTDYVDRLKTGSTRLCRCFRVTRADGAVFGFTDHDSDLVVAGLTCRAGAALAASDASSALGLAPAELDAAGALSADAITEADLTAGVWDGAVVEILDVDWSDPAVYSVLGRYSIGSVERRGIAFQAELRSQAAGLDRPQGRVIAAGCDCRRVGDARCGADLAALGLQFQVTVTAADGVDIWVSGVPASVAQGVFDRGLIRWLSGANAGRDGDIRVARAAGSVLRLSLWHVPPGAVAVGDRLDLSAGCDRTFTTCQARFRNGVNFQGFPHMPGDAALTDRGDGQRPDFDGGSRFS